MLGVKTAFFGVVASSHGWASLVKYTVNRLAFARQRSLFLATTGVASAPALSLFGASALFIGKRFGYDLARECARAVQSMNEAEWQTRKSRIDTRLKQTGWHLVRFTPELNLKTLDKTAVEELPTANGPADYALFVAGRCLGIIE